MDGETRGSDGGEEAPDAFAGVELGEAFVRAATVHEPSAAARRVPPRRSGQAARSIQDRHEAASRARRARREARRRHWRSWVLLTLGALAIGTWLWTAASSPDGLAATSPDLFVHDSSISRFPPPPDDRSTDPLGAPIDLAATSADFRFEATQPDGDAPVAYDPCRPIRVVVNNRTAPEGARELIDDGLFEVGRITGLRFEVEGTTDEVPVHPRSPLQEGRYGNRWAPVLIAWSDPTETEVLAGEVAGAAGSQSISRGSDEQVYVTGSVVLDGPQFTDLLSHRGGYATARAVVLHELGHLVGLAHVDAPDQLMQERTRPDLTEFGTGDLTGLVALGQGTCRPDL